jgi:hypothetical protein
MPLSERINVRMIVFAAVVLFLIGMPLYVFLHAAMTGGITHHANFSEVDLKALGSFPFVETRDGLNAVPPQWRALDGKRVELDGQIYCPNEAGDTMSRFELVYSIQVCCFGGPPKVQERVHGIVPKDMRVPNLHNGSAKVWGILHVNPIKDELGTVVSVYQLDVDRVQPQG